MSEQNEGHLFIDESALDYLAALHPPGPPADWTLNQYGQPSWLLRIETLQFASWGVIVPPPFDTNVPADLSAARALDRRDQGLETWGAGKTIKDLSRILAAGPAMMPAITWSTSRMERRGHPGVGWVGTERSCCAAWLRDVRGEGYREIAAQLFPEVPFDENLEGIAGGRVTVRASRRKVQRYVVAGRQALCDQGVWPWVSASLADIDGEQQDAEGELPAPWWNDDDVLSHLQLWFQVSAHMASERRSEIADVVASRKPAPPDAWF